MAGHSRQERGRAGRMDSTRVSRGVFQNGRADRLGESGGMAVSITRPDSGAPNLSCHGFASYPHSSTSTELETGTRDHRVIGDRTRARLSRSTDEHLRGWGRVTMPGDNPPRHLPLRPGPDDVSIATSRLPRLARQTAGLPHKRRWRRPGG